MSYAEAKARYAAIGVDTEAAMARLKTVPISLHCWQGDDVRGFDTDPTKPLTGGIQTTGNYPGRARTPEELMADMDKVLSLCPGTKKINLHASYAIFDAENPWVDRDKLEPKHFKKWVDVAPPKGERHRPVRELKGFAKVSLQPGESKEVQFTLDKRSLAYYEPELHDFYAESGTYQICVGASSRDLRLTGLLEWQAAQPLPVHFTAASTLKQVMTHPVGAAIIGPILQRMAAAAGSATGKKDDDDSSLSMMMGIQLNTLIDFHVLTEEQLNGILSQINQA